MTSRKIYDSEGLEYTVRCIQSNLSIPDTLGRSKTVLIIEVSLFQRFIYTHYIVVGPLLTVLIIEVSLFQSVHNSRLTVYMYIVHYHGNHFLNPIFLGSESGCHGNVLHPSLCHYAEAKPRQNIIMVQ